MVHVQRLSAAVLLMAAGPASAQSALFDEPTDTISINGSSTITTAMTIEAVLKPMGPGGLVFNEWHPGVEDKQFCINTLHKPYAFVNGGQGAIPVGDPISMDEWHHVAVVYDGAELRIYTDGVLVVGLPENGDVPDYFGRTVIGAIDRSISPPDPFRDAFRGLIDSVRISSVARYAGPTAPSHRGDFDVDADAVMVFNFNEPAGSTVVHDSVSGISGTFGIGFSTATSPTLGGESSELCQADLAEPFGLLDLADVTAFASGFLAMDPIADLVPDGLFDLADINLFVTTFLAGCP